MCIINFVSKAIYIFSAKLSRTEEVSFLQGQCYYLKLGWGAAGIRSDPMVCRGIAFVTAPLGFVFLLSLSFSVL